MSIPIFLSYPKPHIQKQNSFINRLKKYLISRGLEPRTLGVNEYDMAAPLKAIRRLMRESNGIITIAFKRTHIFKGIIRDNADMPESNSIDLNDQWYTSPYCQIEPAMAFQLGLPILIMREKGVCPEGILEKGVVGTYMPEFATENVDYLNSDEWNAIIGQWEGQVRAVVDNKGNPPKLY